MAQSGLNKKDPEHNNMGLVAAVLALFVLMLIAVFNQPDGTWYYLVAFCVCLAFVWYIYSANQDGDVVSSDLLVQTSDKTLDYGMFAEALQHPVFIVGGGGTIRYVNEAGKNVFRNTSVGELISVRFRQPDLRRAIEAALNEKKIVSLEYNEAVPDDRWFAVDVSPIPASKNEERYSNGLFAVVFHELTEAKRSDQMRTDFIANASHELRTPLASLVGYLETLDGPAKNDEKAKKRFIGVMLDQAQRMTRLVNDLLSLSKIEMKAHVKPLDVINLTEIIASVIASLNQLASQMGVEIIFDKSKDIYIHGDRDELLQVFENIIENGCKYGQDGGRVDIELVLTGDPPSQTVTVLVKDYGPGIAAEHQQRITERFYRVDVARSREKQGTGLGLAIVKHILHRHGTRLQIVSKTGEGAEFRVEFSTASNKKEKIV